MATASSSESASTRPFRIRLPAISSARSLAAERVQSLLVSYRPLAAKYNANNILASDEIGNGGRGGSPRASASHRCATATRAEPC